MALETAAAAARIYNAVPAFARKCRLAHSHTRTRFKTPLCILQFHYRRRQLTGGPRARVRPYYVVAAVFATAEPAFAASRTERPGGDAGRVMCTFSVAGRVGIKAKSPRYDPFQLSASTRNSV